MSENKYNAGNENEKKSGCISTVQRFLTNRWVLAILVGAAGNVVYDLSSKLTERIPSLIRLMSHKFGLLVISLFPHLEVERYVFDIAAWVAAILIFSTVFAIGLMVYRKFGFPPEQGVQKPTQDSTELPPYEGLTWRLCLKSGVYRPRCSPDQEIEVMSGKFFPLAVNRYNMLVPTAWEFIRGIKDTPSK